MQQVIRLTLVRHGETTGQSSIRFYGKTDVPLSDLGREQMRRAGAALAGEHFDAVFSSRLSRSREGAAIVAGDSREVTPIATFDEVDFGRWEGWTKEEIEARDPGDYRTWQSGDLGFRYPDGESREMFHSRVVRGLQQVLEETTGKHLLMVLHRGVIAAMIGELLALTNERRLALGIDLGSINVVAQAQNTWQIERANRIDHLAGL